MNVSELRGAWARGVRPEAPGANLEGANLWDANLVGAYLEGANLWDANLVGANLEGANLRYADLWGAYLKGANLTRANLEGANLEGASLTRANLEGAYLKGANLTRANLEGANLRDANLEGANLRDADLWGANLEGAEWGGLQIVGAHKYPIELIPTTTGWRVQIGCWAGLIPELQKLVEGEDWPESVGEQITKYRPILQAAILLMQAYTDAHAQVITDLAEKWGKEAVNE